MTSVSEHVSKRRLKLHIYISLFSTEICLMYILKIIDIRIRESAHCSIHPRVIVVSGLMSVHIDLNVIVMYT